MNREEAVAEAGFSGALESVPEARAWARGPLERLDVPEDKAEDALLVLSELCTNSVRHSRSGGPLGSYLVRLRRGVTRLRIEVTDAGGDGEPLARHPGPGHDHRHNGHSPTLRGAATATESLDEGGHGLALVEAFAARWWVSGGPGGRTVHAEIALDP
jgi:anti-sigma regulatory factor (Ser/Thr protein kinase)